jgi:hypothetical protein
MIFWKRNLIFCSMLTASEEKTMNMIRRFVIALSVIIAMAMTAGSTAGAAENKGKETAAENESDGQKGTCPFEISAESEDDYAFRKGRLQIYGGKVTVKMAAGTEKTDAWIEICGDSEVILDGVQIEAGSSAAAAVRPGIYAQIVLGTENESAQKINTLIGAPGYAGLEVQMLSGGDAAPHVSSNLRISGSGVLKAVGGEGGAGIGSSKGQDSCGTIVIEEGTVIVQGGSKADGIGRGSGNTAYPVTAPRISENVTSLCAAADGEGTAILLQEAGRRSDTEDGFKDACILRGTFAKASDGSLSGLKNVTVTESGSDHGQTFDMPDGYRDFAVAVKEGGRYKISRDGRYFAISQEEMFEEERKVEEESELEMSGSSDSVSPGGYLVPVKDADTMDIKVTGAWKDENDKDGTRPGSIQVTLYANGVDTGKTAILKKANDWSATFEDMPLYKKSSRQSYSIVEERLEGYTGSISGSDEDGYTITNIHEPLPEGRSRDDERVVYAGGSAKKNSIVSTVVTSKVSRSMPARTSITINKTMSAKTADNSNTLNWGILLLAALGALYIWMRFEQKRD